MTEIRDLRPLAPIPVVPEDHSDPAALVHRDSATAQALLSAGRRQYTAAGLVVADSLSRGWLMRTGNPYLSEIDSVSAAIGRPGAYVLNLSHEWGCTTAVLPGDAGGSRLLRVLDWPLDGLGRATVIARRRGRAGRYLAVTWPGFVGLLTGLAPGRFAAAFNQAPLRRRAGVKVADWALHKTGIWRRKALPPAHLMRRVFDECPDYDSARAMLRDTPLCLPTLFALAGSRPGEGCIIERLEDQARVYEAPQAMANHWMTAGFGAGWERGTESEARRRTLLQHRCAAMDFGWLQPPVLNPLTRLAVVADPAGGQLLAQGFESFGPATAPTRVAAAPGDSPETLVPA